jgi:undecaprenyl diphosphate synthase
MPKHVAIIMDGNGRWARSRGLPRSEGHRAGAIAIRRAIESCLENKVKYLTLFSFSTENWNRSEQEVSGLMGLFEEALTQHLFFLIENKVSLRIIGDTSRLPQHVLSAMSMGVSKTGATNSSLELVLALSYGGREEIVAATKKIATKVVNGELEIDQIDNTLFAQNLWASGIPDPELLIRTSGEVRISNFLLWQLAYSEIVVCSELWPEFDREVFNNCLSQYRQRERRFGLTSDQRAQLVTVQEN